MKKVEIIVAREALGLVAKAAREAGGHALCVIDATGIPTNEGVNEFGMTATGAVPVVKIEIFLEDHEAERVADAVSRELGGGDDVNVFLTKSETAMRFRRNVRSGDQ